MLPEPCPENPNFQMLQLERQRYQMHLENQRQLRQLQQQQDQQEQQLQQQPEEVVVEVDPIDVVNVEDEPEVVALDVPEHQPLDLTNKTTPTAVSRIKPDTCIVHNDEPGVNARKPGPDETGGGIGFPLFQTPPIKKRKKEKWLLTPEETKATSGKICLR